MGKVFATHLDRAHGAVQAQHIINIIVQIAMMFQQIGYRGVEIAAAQFRLHRRFRIVNVGIVGYGAHKFYEELLGILKV